MLKRNKFDYILIETTGPHRIRDFSDVADFSNLKGTSADDETLPISCSILD